MASDKGRHAREGVDESSGGAMVATNSSSGSSESSKTKEAGSAKKPEVRCEMQQVR